MRHSDKVDVPGFTVFQFTHPRRMRLQGITLAGFFFDISIHSSTKDETRPFLIVIEMFLFQFTHPRRMRHSDKTKYTKAKTFQFTHPRRMRRLDWVTWLHKVSRFQFTHPRRMRRSDTAMINLYRGISIHSSTKDETAKSSDECQHTTRYRTALLNKTIAHTQNKQQR